MLAGEHSMLSQFVKKTGLFEQLNNVGRRALNAITVRQTNWFVWTTEQCWPESTQCYHSSSNKLVCLNNWTMLAGEHSMLSQFVKQTGLFEQLNNVGRRALNAITVRQTNWFVWTTEQCWPESTQCYHSSSNKLVCLNNWTMMAGEHSMLSQFVKQTGLFEQLNNVGWRALNAITVRQTNWFVRTTEQCWLESTQCYHSSSNKLVCLNNWTMLAGEHSMLSQFVKQTGLFEQLNNVGWRALNAVTVRQTNWFVWTTEQCWSESTQCYHSLPNKLVCLNNWTMLAGELSMLSQFVKQTGLFEQLNNVSRRALNAITVRQANWFVWTTEQCWLESTQCYHSSSNKLVCLNNWTMLAGELSMLSQFVKQTGLFEQLNNVGWRALNAITVRQTNWFVWTTEQC